MAEKPKGFPYGALVCFDPERLKPVIGTRTAADVTALQQCVLQISSTPFRSDFSEGTTWGVHCTIVADPLGHYAKNLVFPKYEGDSITVALDLLTRIPVDTTRIHRRLTVRRKDRDEC